MKRDELESSELEETPWPAVMAMTFGPRDEDDEEKDDEVIAGSLNCARCNERYPIEDSIPNLLPPELRKQASGG